MLMTRRGRVVRLVVVVVVAQGHQITASTAFPALSMLMLLKEPLQRYPREHGQHEYEREANEY